MCACVMHQIDGIIVDSSISFRWICVTLDEIFVNYYDRKRIKHQILMLNWIIYEVAGYNLIENLCRKKTDRHNHLWTWNIWFRAVLKCAPFSLENIER